VQSVFEVECGACAAHGRSRRYGAQNWIRRRFSSGVPV